MELYYLSQKFNRFLVKILFGPKEGVVERFPVYKKDEKDKYGIPKLYIRNKELSHNEISILAVLIMTFGLLAAITAWDSYFLDESFTCTEKPGISCFPLTIDTVANSDLNLADAQNQRITNCSYWDNKNVSSRVTFICFEWIFDSKGVISDVGGLLTMFLITIKIVSSGSLTCLNWAIKRSIEGEKEGNTGRVIFYFRILRHLAVSLAALLELIIVLGVAHMFAEILDTDSKLISNNFFIFFFKHGKQILLIFGIFSTLLLLPLEEYALAEEPSPTVEERVPPGNDNNEHI